MTPHGIARGEWERRFKARLAEKAALTDEDLTSVFEAEIQSWPEQERDDWCVVSPEDAADENLSYWSADE